MRDVPVRPSSQQRVQVTRLEGHRFVQRADAVATEEPLEIRVSFQRQRVWQTVTMRTPGHDFELAAGLLLAEGLIDSGSEIARITYCADAEQVYNTVNVALRTPPNLEHLDAFRVASSACGVCGKASLDALEARGMGRIVSDLRLETDVLYALPDKLRAAQGVFDRTGGLHAAAAFTTGGTLLCVREDVGRHNAVDKLIGWSALNQTSLERAVVLVSGRVAFEIAQKCVLAKIPVLCAIGAPSSLAVQMAVEYHLTLIGFLRGETANMYSAPERIHP